jgi:hypothetical protein
MTAAASFIALYVYTQRESFNGDANNHSWFDYELFKSMCKDCLREVVHMQVSDGAVAPDSYLSPSVCETGYKTVSLEQYQQELELCRFRCNQRF